MYKYFIKSRITIPFDPRMVCTKFIEIGLLILEICFYNIKHNLLFWILFTQHAQGYFVPSQIEIDQLVLEKNIQRMSTRLLLSPLREGDWPSFEQFWISFTQGWFVPTLLQFAKQFWRKRRKCASLTDTQTDGQAQLS
jgi:hypothetical protein